MDEKREWLGKLQEEVEIPEVVWKKVEQTFDIIREEEIYREIPRRTNKSKRRRSKRTMAVIIAAAVLMVSTLTVGAAKYFHWNDSFSKRYNIDPETEKKLNDSNSAKEMNQFTEHDGIRIEAVQSVADSYAAHIVLMIRGSEEFPLESHMGFESIDVQVEGNEMIGWEGRFLKEVTEDWSDGVEYEITVQDPVSYTHLHAQEGIAFSEDLYHWEKVDTPILKHGNAGEIDELHAHKPCVIEKDGTLYHFYCAVRESRQNDKAVNIDPTQEQGEEKTEYRCISVATSRV